MSGRKLIKGLSQALAQARGGETKVRRLPEMSARVLLTLIDRDPDYVRRALGMKLRSKSLPKERSRKAKAQQ